MSNTCGAFAPYNKNGFQYAGELALPYLSNNKLSILKTKIGLQINEHIQSKESPSHMLKAWIDGDIAEIGAVWQKQGKDNGKVFYTLTIDFLGLPEPVNLTAFEKNDGTYEIVYSRPRKQKEPNTSKNDNNQSTSGSNNTPPPPTDSDY